MTKPTVGPLLRDWRRRRRRSQLDLALDVGVSTRHLSYVETGRAQPSAELVLALADGLDVPLRECNTLLLAAGYAPRYPARPLADPALHQARAALRRVLDAHDPYPGVVVDRAWDVVLANRAAAELLDGVPEALRPNVYRMCLHPDGLAARTRNLPEWAGHLLHQLGRSVALTGDPTLAALEREVRGYPGVETAVTARSSPLEPVPLLVPLRLDLDGTELALFTTLTTFGTPRDVTLDELAVELFYPADDSSEALLRGTRAGQLD
ncbi:helix-turn-helix transcriptional regulator [Pseudonocardia sp. WMMC193]|uniref:helix-turn-helix transcriptional regulator n=1 Tax=Pseudonocardia sp. WMMC193 TaxID=2911965 RepID=UPI001F27C5E7|nr:helix-turn-helix transcriptional regulator [Pseudonocardia sp. WMMC193]MCF7551126.1 helix-turn-helix transcriptional regulator [Pseudonocardia sp. WMMC193]